jgi:hypothetical protein
MKFGFHLGVCIGILLIARSVFADDLIQNREVNVKTLCKNNDNIYFTCKTGNKKIVSLCGKGDVKQPEYIYYRFGELTKVDLDYPAEKSKASYQKFSYNHYFRYQTSYFSVAFRNGGYKYIIYNDYSADDSNKKSNKSNISSGINVISEDESGRQINIPCISDIKSELYPLSSFLVCDKELNELGCPSSSDDYN